MGGVKFLLVYVLSCVSAGAGKGGEDESVGEGEDEGACMTKWVRERVCARVHVCERGVRERGVCVMVTYIGWPTPVPVPVLVHIACMHTYNLHGP